MPFSPVLCRRRWLSTLVILGLVVACAADSAGENTPTVRALPLAAGTAVVSGHLIFRGGVEVAGGGIGGLSGLSVFDDGRQFAAISDRGRVVRGRLSYDGGGALVGMTDLLDQPLAGTDAPGLKRGRDSEDLLRLPGGDWLVSFEGTPRLWRYPAGMGRADARPVPLPVPSDTATTPANGGLEAMALLSDGRLLLLEEGADDDAAERRGWLAPALPRDEGEWRRVTYRARPGFRTTAAAALPDGGVLVLERRVSWVGGWGARLTRIPAAAIRPGAELEGDEVAELGPPLPLDNYEGLAVRVGMDGGLRVYLLSDDNVSPLQRTLMLMFTVKE